MTPALARPDLARHLLILLVIGGLIAGSFLVLAPFLLAAVWATAIVVATWPLMEMLQQRFGGRRAPAVLLLTLALLLLLVVPLTLVVITIVDSVDELSMLSARVAWYASMPPPAWLQSLPASEQLIDAWKKLAALTPAELQAKIAPYASRIAGWLLDEASTITLLVVQFLLTVAICAVLYLNGEAAARGVRRFAHRLAGARGDNAVVLAAQAVRAVALGVVVTALVQSVLAGIGLAIAGIPYAGLLTAVTLLLCIAQIGVFPVLLPTTVWLFWSGDTGMAVFFTVWTLVVGTLDNFLRPWLIRRGADLPLLLILAGVIGGLLAFGIVGLFVGPVLLAVTWKLMDAWIAAGEEDEALAQPAAATTATAGEVAGPVTPAATTPATDTPAGQGEATG
jgi:predicted PurR-regulated permease PerM